MTMKTLKNNTLILVLAFFYACSSSQEQQSEELSLDQESQSESANGEYSNQSAENESSDNDGYEYTNQEGNSSDGANSGENELVNYEETADEGENAAQLEDEAMNEFGEYSNDADLPSMNNANSLVDESDAMPVSVSDDESNQSSMEEMMSAGSKVVMYVNSDMVDVFSSPDTSSNQVGQLSAGDTVLAEVAGSFAKIGEGRYVTLDKLSNEIVARTRTPNPWR